MKALTRATLLLIPLLLASGCDSSSNTAHPAGPGTISSRADAARSLPTPASYAETCRLVGSWCLPTTGRIPRELRRPLRLPELALGRGPVQPLIAASGGEQTRGIVPFQRWSGGGHWWSVKTLWFSHPRYRGPVFIRGRRVGGSDQIVFGERPTLVDPQLPPTRTVNGRDGWREWPGATFIRHFGCYAWQVDGTSFSSLIVFKAVKAQGH
ncbi:MAG: hypothetical protein E6G67_07775 [Actinobacteria bacterium]|nr:MAG: hypothetical protein E6G67_07775 [Actinomycetota bacterium]